MRVLTVGNMYPPHHLGGYELAWHSWVGHARARGHEVCVLTTPHREPEPDPDIAEDPAASRELPWYWHDHEFPRLGAREVLELEREAHRVLDRHLEREPDVVCWWAMGGMPLSVIESVRRRGIPAVFVVMDDWCVYGPKVDRWQRAMNRPLIRRLAERFGPPAALELGGRSEQWLFLSDFLRKRTAAAGVAPERTGIVGRGADPGEFPPAAEREWDGSLLCVGRVEQRKGQQVAIAALAELSGCRLRIIGSGERAARERLEALARRLGVADRVSFGSAGRDEIAGAYAAADVVLFPVQWEEPWGFVPLEAMSVGRPVIATGTGGSAEFLRDGENALVYEPRDAPSALATAVRRLEQDAGLRRRLREGGIATAARYTVERFNDAVSGAVEAAGRGNDGAAGAIAG